MSDEKEHQSEPVKVDEGGGSATATKPAPTKTPPKQLPPWKVLLHNDDENDILHVVESIVMLTPLAKEEAVNKTLEAHETGLTLLLVTHQERAELYMDQFTSRGLTVTIEPDEA